MANEEIRLVRPPCLSRLLLFREAYHFIEDGKTNVEGENVPASNYILRFPTSISRAGAVKPWDGETGYVNSSAANWTRVVYSSTRVYHLDSTITFLRPMRENEKQIGMSVHYTNFRAYACILRHLL